MGAALASYHYAGTVAGFVEIEEAELGMQILAALFAFFAIWTLISAVLKRYSFKFTIQGNRITRQRGIISRNQQSVRIEDLRSIQLSQSVLQRIMNVGQISFYSAGSASAEVIFFGIKEPARLKEQINDRMGQLKSTNE